MKKKATSSAKRTSAETIDNGSVPTERLSSLCDEWACYSRIKQHSDRTIGNRRYHIDRLVSWLKASKRENCSTAELREFFSSLCREVDGKPMRPSSVCSFHISYLTFWNWMIAEGIVTENPMLRVPKPSNKTDTIQVFESDQFRRMVEVAGKGPQGKRNVAILRLLMDTGMRASELCDLRLCDVDLTTGKIRVHGKGNKYRTVFFGTITGRSLRSYLRTHPECDRFGITGDDKRCLFLCESGPHQSEPMTRSGIYQMIRKLGKRCGLQGVRCSTHTARHTSATEFIRNGGNAQALQDMLGHATSDMTRRYLHLSESDLKSEHRKASPVDRMKRR